MECPPSYSLTRLMWKRPDLRVVDDADLTYYGRQRATVASTWNFLGRVLNPAWHTRLQQCLAAQANEPSDENARSLRAVLLEPTCDGPWLRELPPQELDELLKSNSWALCEAVFPEFWQQMEKK